MKTLVIHEIRREFFNFPLHEYVLTFDDALYSQYYYLPLINEIKTKKIFFVPTGLIGYGEKRQQYEGEDRGFPSCYEAMAEWKDKANNENYMRVSELREIRDEIGGHGHGHIKEYGFELYDQVRILEDDTIKMLKWLQENLKVRPTKFAFPHYVQPKFGKLIQKRHFREVFVDERTTIEEEFNL